MQAGANRDLLRCVGWHLAQPVEYGDYDETSANRPAGRARRWPRARRRRRYGRVARRRPGPHRHQPVWTGLLRPLLLQGLSGSALRLWPVSLRPLLRPLLLRALLSSLPVPLLRALLRAAPILPLGSPRALASSRCEGAECARSTRAGARLMAAAFGARMLDLDHCRSRRGLSC